MSRDHRPRRARAFAAVLAAIVVAGGLLLTTDARSHHADAGEPTASSKAGGPARTVAAPRTPHDVGLARCTLRDPTRSTFDYATGATIPGRTLVTEVRYPTSAPGAGEIAGAPAAYRSGPYPTIFFAPGFDVTPDTYAALLDAWVRAGFVVVAPTFPDTNPTAVAAARVGDAEDDVVNQPADVAFLVRTTIAATRTVLPACRVLHGLVDVAELGVAGQSDGGETTAMLAYDRGPGYATLDAGLGIKAAAVLSGAEIGTGPFEATPGDPALLVVQSSTDQCNPPQDSTQLYNGIVQRDKWFLDLHDADHLPPYDGDDAAAFSAVSRVTIRFFELELHHKLPGAGFLAYGNAAPSVASISTGPAAPPIPALGFETAACYLR